jgi:hypothetical protein
LGSTATYTSIKVSAGDNVTVQMVADGGVCGNSSTFFASGASVNRPMVLHVPGAFDFEFPWVDPVSGVVGDQVLSPTPISITNQVGGYNGSTDLMRGCHIRVRVQHPQILPPDFPGAPMDLVWDNTDPNGIPFNPEWNYQRVYPGKLPNPVQFCGRFMDASVGTGGPYDFTLGTPPCTTQALEHDKPPASFGPVPWLCASSVTGAADGHINWMPATYVGTVYAGSYQHGAGLDGDYNIEMRPPNKGGLTTLGPDLIEAEMRDTETVELFNNTPLWKAIEDSKGHVIDGTTGVIIGLLGLDATHSFQTELHPAFAAALQVPQTPPGSDRVPGGPDGWAFFFRNSGNEGNCSHEQHHLALETPRFRLQIPWQKGATWAKVTSYSAFQNSDVSGISGPYFNIVQLKYVEIGFDVPHDGDFRIHGDVFIDWNGPLEHAPRVPPVWQFASFSDPIGALVQIRDTSPSGIQRIESELPPVDRFVASMLPPAGPEVTADSTPVNPPDGRINVSNGRFAISYPVVDPNQAQWAREAAERTCQLYNGRLPGNPLACDALAWQNAIPTWDTCTSASRKSQAYSQQLGERVGGLQPAFDGRGIRQEFANGILTWTDIGCARLLLREIARLWKNGAGVIVGYPMGDETEVGDLLGRVARFEHGAIFWRHSTGAHEVHGSILALYDSLGGPRGWLGYPVTDEIAATPQGRVSRFEHGSIAWTVEGGAVAYAKN